MTTSKEIFPVNIEDEMKGAYLDYAMSVIVGRALPDGRDGLKPVHRRILYAMFREGLLSNRRYSKCAGVVGEVLKKFHPHGDMAVYDTLVRMAQPWNMRYLLIDGQGNFGSLDGDSAAAYRYTESRLMAIAEELMADIDKETVDFTPNFDESTVEPVVFPTLYPNLLVNGSDGIAVGMATKIPPHNLREVISGCLLLIDNPAATLDDLIKLIPGPDFPTAAQIMGRTGIRQAYETGRGIITLRAKTEIEIVAKTERERIVVTEIPFQVNKARLIETMADLVNDEKIEGISEIRDESDRHGLRIVIELKKGVIGNVILNQLYKHTALQTSFGTIMLVIVNKEPRVMTLKGLLLLFINHRKEVVVRRTQFELREAQKRAHILEGLKIAVENIDRVIEIIKKAPNPQEAKTGLIAAFKFSEIQAQAILELRLQRLTGLERDKIIAEYKEVLALIDSLKAILADEKKVLEIIKKELTEISTKYGDERRTEIVAAGPGDFSTEDLIQDEDVVVTVSHHGYIKRVLPDVYRAQRRGGRGKMGMTTRDEDFVEQIFVASTHSSILAFTSLGKVHWLKVYEIPEAAPQAKGKAITNFLTLENGEKVSTVLPVKTFDNSHFLVFVTKNGTVKKTELEAYSRPRAGGILAITIEPGDELVAVKITDGKKDILISTEQGQTIRFNEDEARAMGRTATGVRGISLAENDRVIDLSIVQNTQALLTVSEKGYGKRTALEEYRVQGRGGSGILTMKTTDKTGLVVSTLAIEEKEDIMLITNQGKVIRMKVGQISIIGRNTQGVRLIQLEEGEKVVGVARLAEKEEESLNAIEHIQ